MNESTSLRHSATRTLRVLTDALGDGGERCAIEALQRDGSSRWQYAELAQAVRALAAGLTDRGIGPGSNVLLLAPNRPEWIVAALATVHAGATIVPVDAQSATETVQHIVDDCQPSLVFTTASLAAGNGLHGHGSSPCIVLLDEETAQDGGDTGHWRELASGAGSDRASTPDAGKWACLFYTSGTTGFPKGVPLSHDNVLSQIDALTGANFVRTEDRVLLPLPMHHVYPFVMGLLVPLSMHLCVVLPHAMTGPGIVRAVREGQASVIIGVPRLYRALLEGMRERISGGRRWAGAVFDALLAASGRLGAWTGTRPGRFLFAPLHRRLGPRLRLMASGGSALEPSVGRKLAAFGWQVATGYGLTETSPLLTWNLPGRARLDTAGEPVPGVEIRIDTGRVVSDDEDAGPGPDAAGQGEVLVRGANVFAGYLNRDDDTAASFTSDGWFRTGDLGTLDEDGYLQLGGRVSTLIVTDSGKNIQPDQIEDALAADPAIAEAGVLQHDGRLVAVVVPDVTAITRQGRDIDATVHEAVNRVSRGLPSYQRVADIAVSREGLARTRLGKIRRHLLASRFEALKQGTASAAGAGPMALEEMSESDQALLEEPRAQAVWQWLAKHYPEHRLTPDSSPQLDLGIDSLEWLNVTLAVGELTDVQLDEEAIARVQTVRDLMMEVSHGDEGGEGLSREQALRDPEAVISDAQRRWLADRGPVLRVVARSLYPLNRLVMRLAFSLEVSGRERLPREGSVLLAPNHLSYLDPFVLAGALDDDWLSGLWWTGWTGAVFSSPLRRLLSRLGQVAPIDPQRAAVSSLALAAAILHRGRRLVLFPEGARSPDGRLQPFRAGIGLLLAEHRVPVVPVWIEGTWEALPPDRSLPRRHPVSVTFGEALDAGALEREGRGETPAERIVDALRGRFEAMAGKAGGSDAGR